MTQPGAGLQAAEACCRGRSHGVGWREKPRPAERGLSMIVEALAAAERQRASAVGYILPR
jgi:hypothetical protein